MEAGPDDDDLPSETGRLMQEEGKAALKPPAGSHLPE
jgi:hypothetical protein